MTKAPLLMSVISKPPYIAPHGRRAGHGNVHEARTHRWSSYSSSSWCCDACSCPATFPRCRRWVQDYPIFLPPRSLAQGALIIDTLKRPGAGRRRRSGVQLRSLARARTRHRQATRKTVSSSLGQPWCHDALPPQWCVSIEIEHGTDLTSKPLSPL